METIRPIQEIINTNILQKVQDEFAAATDMGFITVDYKGTPITAPSRFTDFCKIVRAKTKVCNLCDAHGGLRAEIDDKPVIYKCHTGLLDFAVPLSINGTYCGAILGGQILCEEEHSKDIVKQIIDIKTKWQEDTDMYEARKKIKALPVGKIKAYLSLLQTTIEYLLAESFNNLTIVELVEKNKIILDEKKKRMDLEIGMDKLVSEKNQYFVKNQAMMDYLSVISDMAYMEEADKTQTAVYVLAQYIRYSYSNNPDNISDIQHEIEYVKAFLAMEKIRIGEKLLYTIGSYEEYNNVSCPVNILKPIVENAIVYTIEPYKNGGKVTISLKQENKDLLIIVSDMGKGFPQEVIDNIVNDKNIVVGTQNRYELFKINRILIFLYGKKYGLAIENNRNGAEVIVRIPLK